MYNSYSKIKTHCFLVFAACCILSASPAAAQIYVNDFEGAVGSEWSNNSTDITPTGARTFLGQFGNQTVSLTLASVPACNVTVSFELFLIQSWDGNGDHCCGPDVFDVSVGGGPELLHTTFSNVGDDNTAQAYPDAYPGGVNSSGSGAAESNTLGYSFWGDSVYNLSFIIAHAGGPLVLNFSASGLQGIGDESWGLDNVLVNCLPDCSNAAPSVATLWPANHKMVPVSILGVTDPDGDPVTIIITGITSDEPTASDKGSGGAKYAPDADGVGTDTAQLRAERSGKGNGRVYEISFTASDSHGGECDGSVTVCVPHDQGKGNTAIDDGQNYDATQINQNVFKMGGSRS